MRNFEDAWNHPDWYDLHDTSMLAGSQRADEHYSEAVLSLPPLGQEDHLVDVGAGTGLLALLIARGYPRLGQVTLVEPIGSKLERARERIEAALPDARVGGVVGGLGRRDTLPAGDASLATLGSVLMPHLELGEGTFEDGLEWLRTALAELRSILRPGGILLAVETTAPPWTTHEPAGAMRRLHLDELVVEIGRAELEAVECSYRFRDRVVLLARRPVTERRPSSSTSPD